MGDPEVDPYYLHIPDKSRIRKLSIDSYSRLQQRYQKSKGLDRKGKGRRMVVATIKYVLRFVSTADGIGGGGNEQKFDVSVEDHSSLSLFTDYRCPLGVTYTYAGWFSSADMLGF